MGDFNINLLNSNSHKPTNDFVDILLLNSFYPTISKPTRITYHSSTLIDNIITNNLDHDMISGIIYTDLSDHLPIFLFSDLNIIPKPEPNTYTTRQVTSHSLE
jgi:hypothetical protein